MKTLISTIIVILTLAGSCFLGLVPGLPWKGIISTAEAVIGRPATPMSYAGVARRSVYRGAVVAPVAAAAVVTATVATGAAASQQAAATQKAAAAQAAAPVAQLPQGCTAAADATGIYNCNGARYRAAYQGNAIVYVPQAP